MLSSFLTKWGRVSTLLSKLEWAHLTWRGHGTPWLMMWRFSIDLEEYEDLEMMDELHEAEQLQDEELNKLIQQVLPCMVS